MWYFIITVTLSLNIHLSWWIDLFQDIRLIKREVAYAYTKCSRKIETNDSVINSSISFFHEFIESKHSQSKLHWKWEVGKYSRLSRLIRRILGKVHSAVSNTQSNPRRDVYYNSTILILSVVNTRVWHYLWWLWNLGSELTKLKLRTVREWIIWLRKLLDYWRFTPMG